MKILQLTFGAFVEIAPDPNHVDSQTGRKRAVVYARARAMDAQCEGRTESDALVGLAECYERAARQLRHAAFLANRQWAVTYRAGNSPQRTTIRAASEDEAAEAVRATTKTPIVIDSIAYVPEA
jgi:hypothetical protein